MALNNWFRNNPFGTGPRTIEWIYLNRTGGDVTCLDGEPTWGDDDSGTNCRIVVLGNTTAEVWQLISSNHINDPTNGWVRPLDYMDGENQKVWKRVFCFGSGGGGGGTIPPTTDLLSGDGSGNAADSGIAPANVVVKHLTFPTPSTLNQVIACLQNAGLCI